VSDLWLISAIAACLSDGRQRWQAAGSAAAAA
jgi:hypothetical protein